jgi:hypothetical protein
MVTFLHHALLEAVGPRTKKMFHFQILVFQFPQEAIQHVYFAFIEVDFFINIYDNIDCKRNFY